MGIILPMKVAYLDRDGVINIKAPAHHYITRWEQFRFYPDIFKLLLELQNENYRLIVVTNQQGIGKGLFSINDLAKIHNKMINVFQNYHIKIEKIYYCPHLVSEKCDCRKPKIGMFLQSLIDFPDIDISNSILIGDSDSDIIAGNTFGVKTFWFDEHSASNLCGEIEKHYSS